MESVPTAVVRAPDGSYLVGELTGLPFPQGAANVYRVPAGGGTPVVVASGFTTISDIALGADGALYVLEYSTTGIATGEFVQTGHLIKIAADGRRTELARGALVAPLGLAVDRRGTVYVANHGLGGFGLGEIVRIRQ